MRSQLEFMSDAFPPNPDEENTVNPGRFGESLARFLAAQLPLHGYQVRNVYAEDWGWCVELHHEPFALWIGCGNQEETENGFLCFVEPSRPFIRKWFRKYDTRSIVDQLRTTMERILQDSGKIRELRWVE